MKNTFWTEDVAMRGVYTRMSYQTAIDKHRMQSGLARISWVTWLLACAMLILWGITSYEVARSVGAHSFQEVLSNILANAVEVRDQDNNALSAVLIRFGAKDNDLIMQGQYWRFITPIFLHANALHALLNVLNFVVLGVFLERLVGHLRFLLIYILCGVISIIASFYFSPQEVSVGASGAIFGLVGAYSVFILVHRRAFRLGGAPAILWLVMVIGLNLSIGFFVQNVDNFAHVGGLLSGCLLGWWFTPVYRLSARNVLIDVHSLARRWPLALLTILGTLVLAIIALYLLRPA